MKPPLMHKKVMQQLGVIFDMDGVLVDSNEAHYLAFQEMAALLGVPFPRELWARSIGMHNSSIFRMWLGEGLEPARALALAAQKEAIYRARAADVLKPIPGVVELVQGLHAEKVPLAVGSSGPRLNVEFALRTIGVGHYFNAVVCGDDVKHGKPDPEIFLTAAARLGLSPAQCVVIEDAPQGVQAAVSAQMRVIAITTSKPASELGAASLIIDSFAGLNGARISQVTYKLN